MDMDNRAFVYVYQTIRWLLKLLLITCKFLWYNYWYYNSTAQTVDNKVDAPKEMMAIEYKKTPEVEEAKPPSPPPPEPVKVEAPVVEPPDLLVTS